MYRRIAILVVSVSTLALLPAHAVLAAGPQPADIHVSAPAQISVGDQVKLSATVTDASGSGVPGIQVTFSETASFLNTNGSVILGRRVTDAQGKTVLDYVPRSQGDISITAQLLETAKSLSAATAVQVNPGPAQFGAEPVGVNVPGVSVWMLVIVLGGIWVIFLWAILQVRAIFGQGQKGTSHRGGRLEGHHV
ncbi:MAG: Ig-like domain-containing protein [Dehalococcoidia bacterium]|nr:Ig-like domain-containing protein [Dehalococcoidia bacterium]